MLKDEIVNFDVAKLAKEKGFPQFIDGEENCYWGEIDGELKDLNSKAFLLDILPREKLTRKITQSLLQRWLREKNDIHINITHLAFQDKYIPIINTNNVRSEFIMKIKLPPLELCDTYEQALENALKYSLEYLCPIV